MSGTTTSSSLGSSDLLTWDTNAIKIESPDNVFVDDFSLTSMNSGGDFAELKPLAYDYPNTALTTVSIGSSLTIDPVLSSNNNNSKSMTDLNLSSPSSNGSISSTTVISFTFLSYHIFGSLTPPTITIFMFLHLFSYCFVRKYCFSAGRYSAARAAFLASM